MFDLGATELLLIVIVAVIVIGPKDMPLAMRTAGRWIGKVRRVSSHFRAGLDAMVREAEMEDMEKKWREQNERIMQQHPAGATEMEPTGALPSPVRNGSAESGSGAPQGHTRAPEGSGSGPTGSDGGAKQAQTAQPDVRPDPASIAARREPVSNNPASAESAPDPAPDRPAD